VPTFELNYAESPEYWKRTENALRTKAIKLKIEGLRQCIAQELGETLEGRQDEIKAMKKHDLLELYITGALQRMKKQKQEQEHRSAEEVKHFFAKMEEASAQFGAEEEEAPKDEDQNATMGNTLMQRYHSKGNDAESLATHLDAVRRAAWSAQVIASDATTILSWARTNFGMDRYSLRMPKNDRCVDIGLDKLWLKAPGTDSEKDCQFRQALAYYLGIKRSNNNSVKQKTKKGKRKVKIHVALHSKTASYKTHKKLKAPS